MTDIASAEEHPRYSLEPTLFTLNQRDFGASLPGHEALEANEPLRMDDASEEDQVGAPALLEHTVIGNDHYEASARSGYEPNRLELARQDERIACTSPGCRAMFTKVKSLNRHRRTVHNVSVRVCPYPQCSDNFRRQDILDRHVREQHDGEREMRECPVCRRLFRPRTLRLHMNTPACHAAAGITLTDVLAAPVEVIRLGVELFVKFRPWGENRHYLDWHPVPNTDMKITNEVKELEALLYRQLKIALGSPFVKQDASLIDALSIITVFTCQTRGWEPSMVHCKILVFLALHQIMTLDKEIVSFKEPSAGALEVLRTVLLSNVPEHHVSTCEGFLVRLLRMMRDAACITGFLCFGHANAPIIKSADQFYDRWYWELCAIAIPAESVTC